MGVVVFTNLQNMQFEVYRPSRQNSATCYTRPPDSKEDAILFRTLRIQQTIYKTTSTSGNCTLHLPIYLGRYPECSGPPGPKHLNSDILFYLYLSTKTILTENLPPSKGNRSSFYHAFIRLRNRLMSEEIIWAQRTPIRQVYRKE